jgi:hypothetical protein
VLVENPAVPVHLSGVELDRILTRGHWLPPCIRELDRGSRVLPLSLDTDEHGNPALTTVNGLDALGPPTVSQQVRVKGKLALERLVWFGY